MRRPARIPWAVALAAMAVTAAPSPATAARQCSLSATVTSGEVVDILASRAAPAGASATAVTRLDRRGIYHARRDSTITFDHVRYTLEAGSITTLRCFGQTRGQGSPYPSVELYSGTVTASTTAGRPGAIVSNEGLFDPYASRALRWSVTRTPRGAPSPGEVVARGPSSVLFATTRIDLRGRAGYLNITPYVGRRSGTCRYARGALLRSTRIRRRAFEGTSTFIGLAPFSPR